MALKQVNAANKLIEILGQIGVEQEKGVDTARLSGLTDMARELHDLLAADARGS